MSPSPELQSKYIEFMVEHNRPRMAGFKRWIFHPGMRFQAWQKWWGDQGHRAAPHEGLDLHTFEDADGRVKTVDQHIHIPAPFAGWIVKIERDFLGKSIFMSHAIFAADGRQLWSALGHTVPRDFLKTGQQVAAGEVIATIAGFPGKQTNLQPHVHLTFAWAPLDCRADQLTWENLGSDPEITLIDPLTVILSLL